VGIFVMLFAGMLVAGSWLTYFIGFSASFSDCFLVPATSFNVRITENFFQKTLISFAFCHTLVAY